MKSVIPVENSDVLGALRGFLKSFLETGLVDALYVPLETEKGAIVPALVIDPARLERLNPLAPAIHAADACYRAPRIKDPEYLPAILRLCDRENINLIIPLMDLDIVTFSRNRQIFEKKGVQFLLHPPETIETSMDKLATFDLLEKNGLPTPMTFLSGQWEEAVRRCGFPLMVKARYADMKASGDYWMRRLQSQKELKEALGQISGKEDRYVLQEYLGGTEITVDFFCNPQGEVVSVVPGLRLSALSKAFSQDGGAIDQGRTFHDPGIDALVAKLARATRFWGAANFQGYLDPEKEIKIVEINPRFSGATVMTRGAGHDYFQWSIDLASGKGVPHPVPEFRDTCMASWLSPIFFPEAKIPPI